MNKDSTRTPSDQFGSDVKRSPDLDKILGCETEFMNSYRVIYAMSDLLHVAAESGCGIDDDTIAKASFACLTEIERIKEIFYREKPSQIH